jgi:hypothetical protein
VRNAFAEAFAQAKAAPDSRSALAPSTLRIRSPDRKPAAAAAEPVMVRRTSNGPAKVSQAAQPVASRKAARLPARAATPTIQIIVVI